GVVSSGQERNGQGVHGGQCEGESGLFLQHSVSHAKWAGRVEVVRETQDGAGVGGLSKARISSLNLCGSKPAPTGFVLRLRANQTPSSPNWSPPPPGSGGWFLPVCRSSRTSHSA